MSLLIVPSRAADCRKAGFFADGPLENSEHSEQGSEWGACYNPTRSWRGTAYFFTTEVWTARGLVKYFTLLVIDIATRRVYIAGTTTNPTSAWMAQIARNLTDCEDGFLTGKRFLVIDRDTIFSSVFKSILNGG
jgi:hypothetical protein